MKTFAFVAATATALTLTMANVAFAQTTQTTQSPMIVAAGEMTKAKEVTSDSWITTKVKTELMAKKGVPGIGVEVDTKDGVVTLSSTKTLTQAEKNKAITITKHIKGVKGVMADGLKTQ